MPLINQPRLAKKLNTTPLEQSQQSSIHQHRTVFRSFETAVTLITGVLQDWDAFAKPNKCYLCLSFNLANQDSQRRPRFQPEGHRMRFCPNHAFNQSMDTLTYSTWKIVSKLRMIKGYGTCFFCAAPQRFCRNFFEHPEDQHVISIGKRPGNPEYCTYRSTLCTAALVLLFTHPAAIIWVDQQIGSQNIDNLDSIRFQRLAQGDEAHLWVQSLDQSIPRQYSGASATEAYWTNTTTTQTPDSIFFFHGLKTRLNWLLYTTKYCFPIPETREIESTRLLEILLQFGR